MTVLRLILVNALIRVAAAASGQLFAFLLAERVGGPSGLGSAFVGALGGSFFVAELFGAPVAGRIADARGHRRVLKIGPVLGVLSASVAAAAFRIPHLGVLLAVLVVARTSEGLSAACAVPTTLTLLSRATEGDPVRRTRVMGLFEITSLIGMIVGYAAWPRHRTLAASLVAMIGVAATLALVNHGAPRGALALVVACILVESGFTPAALAHLADITGRHDESRGAALGLYSLLLGGGQLVGNAAGAPFAARWQMDGVLLVTAILALVALAGVARMGDARRRQRR